MHSSLISRVASIDADSFVHFAKEIPQRAANLYVDEAYSPANMAQLVLALAKHSQGGLWLESEPTLLDACHQMIIKVQVNVFWQRVGTSTLPMVVYNALRVPLTLAPNHVIEHALARRSCCTARSIWKRT